MIRLIKVIRCMVNKFMKYFAIHAIVLCVVFTEVFSKDNPRTSIREFLKYTIKESDNSYSFVMQGKVTKTYYTVPLPKECKFRIFQPSRCEIYNVEAKLNGEKIDRITKYNESNEDVFLDDNYIHLIDYSKVHVSSLMKLDVSYQKECNNPLYFEPLFIYNTDSLEIISIEFNHSDNIIIDCHSWFSRISIPFSIERTSSRTIFTIKEIPRFDYLPFFPYNSLHGVFQFSIKKNNVDLFSNSHAGFTKWYMNQINQLPKLVKEDIRELEDRILKLPNNEAKIKMIYDWVRTNVRYIAEEQDYGAFIPRNASKVFHRKFGDCKDKALLVKEMAELFGIKVYLALINTNPTFYIDEKVYLNQFNHMICYTVINDMELLFDPTERTVEFGFLPDRDINKPVFILNENNPRFIYSKEDTTKSSSFLVDLTTKLQGELESVGTITLKNKKFGVFQYYVDIGNVDKGLEYVRRELAEYFPKIQWSNLSLKEITKTEAVFTVNGLLNNFLVKTKKNIYIPHLPFTVIDEEVFVRKKDLLPLYFKKLVNIAFKLTISSNQYSLISPSKKEVGYRAGVYLSTESRTTLDNDIVMSSQLIWNSNYITKEKKDTFFYFFDELSSSRNNYFIISYR